MSHEIKLAIKVVIIGDGAVGKTSLCRRFLWKTFTHEYKQTIGADFYVYLWDTYLEELNVRVDVKWILYDLAGQFVTFQEIRPQFYMGARAALVVFDISRPETFKSVPIWIYEYWKNVSGRNMIEKRPLVLVGNKIDLREKVTNSVPPEWGKNYAEKLTKSLGFEVPYVETSALYGWGVNEAFKKLLVAVLKYYGLMDRLIKVAEEK